MDLLYRAGKLTVAPLVRLGWRIHVTGLEHVPARGGVILAANHLSVADQLFLGVVVPRQVHFWAKSEYFQLPGLKGAVIKGVVSGLGAIPVHREGGRAALGALDAAIPVLRSGAVVGIFPEGTRSPDGRLYRGRTGTARLSVAAEVPVVPVGIIGTDRVQPIGQRFPTPGKRVTIRFGEPLSPQGRGKDISSQRAYTDELMKEIQRLTGQEYTGHYAPPKRT
ncbi:MAG TPA: lysophospholipid acyltransferase family protein [Natronosporangium sp.]|nr:lysophospholipid acyltransferase family protein [Natronosporangium sp.]